MIHTKKHPSTSKATYSFNEDDSLGLHSTAASQVGMMVGGAFVQEWGTSTGKATSIFTGVKKVTAIADATATTVLTVTIPNSAQSALLELKYLGILGAGGAVGAGEAVAGGEVLICFTRTAGLASVINIGTATNTCTCAVAGATTVTATIDNAAVSGGNTATQTFAIRITITKGGGASANHVALLDFDLDNLNGSGITIA